MRNLMRGAAVLLAAAGLAAGAAGAAGTAGATGAAGTTGTAPSAVATWKVVKTVPGEDFTAVVATGRNSGWAFGTSLPPTTSSVPGAWRRSGSSWTRVAFPGQRQETVVAAAATSASDVWAFTTGGSRSRALHWNGRAWTVVRTFTRMIGGAAVISPGDVWVFGQPFFPDASFGAWHYNGRTWSQAASGRGLEGGSGLSAHDVWGFEGTDVAHWNGSSWSRTSVARLLPAAQKTHLNDPAVTGVFEQGPRSVYATGNGNQQDDGGPMVLLHWNGRTWSKVAGGLFGFDVGPVQPIASDGHGGLWIPMAGPVGDSGGHLLHYSGGHLTTATVPGGPSRTSLATVARVPGTAEVLAGGFTHAAGNAGLRDAGVLLEYES